jgi:hypothetical protein
VAIRTEKLLLQFSTLVRYLYAPGDLEGRQLRRSTDPIWSLTFHTIRNVVKTQPALYYLIDGPARRFVREELLVVPEGTELLPSTKIAKTKPLYSK